ncbi:protein rolling stone-like [Mytilus californianus]|uniref:protein rolling stone-like n=1 Tax=Mytilus californianus TaxID=6549 RepID=UPI0022479FDB|nr:protein rolling stone-like [Mytilus californianus]
MADPVYECCNFETKMKIENFAKREVGDKVQWSMLGCSNKSPVKFVSSECCKCGCNVFYPIWATFWLLYHVIWMLVDFSIKETEKKKSYFIYLTHWGYLLLIIYNFIDCVVTWIAHCKKKESLQREDIKMPWYLKLSWVLFNTSHTAALCITPGYYLATALSDEMQVSLSPSGIEFHAINSGYVVLNMFVCAKEIRLPHVTYSMIFGSIYEMFSLIYQLGIDNDPIYPPLDWKDTVKTSVLVTLGIVVGIPLINGLCIFGLYKLRICCRNLCKKCCESNNCFHESRMCCDGPRACCHGAKVCCMGSKVADISNTERNGGSIVTNTTRTNITMVSAVEDV